MTPDAPLIEVAQLVVADLRRWYRAFSGLTGYAVDMGHAAQTLTDAAKREEHRLDRLLLDFNLARRRIAQLEGALLDYLDDPDAEGALERLGSALRQDFEEAVRLG